MNRGARADALGETGATPSDTLRVLADRCEREEPSRDLDAAIFEAVSKFPANIPVGRGSFNRAPAYTTSLDAAVTLVPEGHWRRSGGYSYAWAEVGSAGKNPADFHTGHASNEAMAICMAALRARAAAAEAMGHPEGPQARSTSDSHFQPAKPRREV